MHGVLSRFGPVSTNRHAGYSRVPVFKRNGTCFEMEAILFLRDLMFIDPEDKMPVAALIDFYQRVRGRSCSRA
jgi:hypothetical protein